MGERERERDLVYCTHKPIYARNSEGDRARRRKGIRFASEHDGSAVGKSVTSRRSLRLAHMYVYIYIYDSPGS